MLERLWEIPHIQGQRSPNKTIGGAIMFRIKPHTHQRSTEGSDKCCAHWTQRPHRDWDRTVIECLLWRYRSAVDCCGGRGSGCMRPGYGISPLGGCRHWPHWRAARTYTGLGNRLLKGTNKTLCAPGSRRKEEWAHNRLTQTCLWAGVSNRGVGRGGLLRVRGTLCSSLWMGPLKVVTIIFTTSTIVWHQVKL